MQAYSWLNLSNFYPKNKLHVYAHIRYPLD
jgi:hypothetical protein